VSASRAPIQRFARIRVGRFARPFWHWEIQAIAWAAMVFVLAGATALLIIGVSTALLWFWGVGRGEQIAIGSWLCHLLGMVAAMYLGMLVYMDAIRPAMAGLLGPGFASTGASYVGMLVAMALGMVVLMRVEGHSLEMCAEMSLAMLAPVVAVFALLGAVSEASLPFTGLTLAAGYSLAHDAMLLGMIGLMVYQRRMYGSE